MGRAGRVLAVTAGLAVAGAVTGAICGLVALTPLIISGWLRPPFGYNPVILSEIGAWAAAAGAALGALFGPLLAWSILRHVPLGRIILWAAVGTVVGSFAGWGLTASAISPGLPAIFGGGLLGMVAAGIGLRRRAAKLVRGGQARPAALPAAKLIDTPRSPKPRP